MKITFLPSSSHDVAWYSLYYNSIFKAGEPKARLRLSNMLKLLAANPNIGHPEGPTDERELSVPKTPFSIIYRIRGDQIQILRLWDQRRDEEGKINWI